MNISGERILIFGDSLSHPGSDGAPYTFTITDGSNRVSSAPGDLLASMLLEAGAEAVQINARVGRSAYSFWNREDAASLIQADAAFAPSKVVVILGTNDIGLDLATEQTAFQQIKNTYEQMGAEVWAIGPLMYVGNNNGNLNDGALPTAQMMAQVFGERMIDGRPLSVNAQRAGDGIHFTPLSAAPTASNMLRALQSQSATPVLKWLGWLALGIGAIVGLGLTAKFLDKRRSPELLGTKWSYETWRDLLRSDDPASMDVLEDLALDNEIKLSDISGAPGAPNGTFELAPMAGPSSEWKMVQWNVRPTPGDKPKDQELVRDIQITIANGPVRVVRKYSVLGTYEWARRGAAADAWAAAKAIKALPLDTEEHEVKEAVDVAIDDMNFTDDVNKKPGLYG